MFLVPELLQAQVGESFHVDVRLDTGDQSVNAVQTKINFPSNILKLDDTDKAESVFSFWLQEPAISQESGTLQFISGTTKGISGPTLEVLRLNFTALAAGEATLFFSESAVTANDGQGTDVLSETRGVVIKSEPVSVVSVPEVIVPIEHILPEQPDQVQPQPVVREPVLALARPKSPQIQVPLYPDPENWYNQLGEVIVFWDLPNDVDRIATALDRNPNTSPENIENILTDGKKFGALDEGVWYVHVQFHNNVGWGQETHYRIALDLTPPLSFGISIDPRVSDNPTPSITFETQDAMSGISHSQIFIDGQTPLNFPSNEVELPPQSPGKHTIVVKVFDFAGNSVEDVQEFEILPLPTPTISFISGSASTEEQFFVSGKSIVSAFVDIRIYDQKQKEAERISVSSDDTGNWNVSVTQNLAAGRYTLTATARDERGATSLPTTPEFFRIRPATVISLGFIDLGWFEISLIIILLVIAGLGLYGWYYLGLKRKRRAYAIIAARDVGKMHELLSKNLNGLENNIKNLENFYSPVSRAIDPTFREESLAFIRKMKEVLEKTHKYVEKEVEELK